MEIIKKSLLRFRDDVENLLLKDTKTILSSSVSFRKRFNELLERSYKNAPEEQKNNISKNIQKIDNIRYPLGIGLSAPANISIINQLRKIKFKTEELLDYLGVHFETFLEKEKGDSSVPKFIIIQNNKQIASFNISIEMINKTIDSLEDKCEKDKEIAKTKVEELINNEKNKGPWEKSKKVLFWLADFSQKLFYHVLPILIQHYHNV